MVKLVEMNSPGYLPRRRHIYKNSLLPSWQQRHCCGNISFFEHDLFWKPKMKDVDVSKSKEVTDTTATPGSLIALMDAESITKVFYVKDLTVQEVKTSLVLLAWMFQF